jgi:predicted amidohydrolase
MLTAALQFSAVPFDLTRNLETARRLVRQAAENGAQLVVLPELFNTGYVYSSRLAAFAEDPRGVTLRVLGDLSAELGVHIAGSLLLRERGHVYDTLVVIPPGGRLITYRKQHPFLWERCYFEAGQSPCIAETELGRLGLMVCWDASHPSAWQAYAGRVDAVVIASAPPRLHRAVLNFPLGRKIYAAQLMPGLLRQREALDQLYLEEIGLNAARLAVPVVHAVMAGRFVTELPFPRLSFLAAAISRPRFWPLIAQAHLASLRATFYGGSAIFGPDGAVLARVESDEGIALAETGAAGPSQRRARSEAAPPGLSGFAQLRLFERMLLPLASRYYQQHRVAD